MLSSYIMKSGKEQIYWEYKVDINYFVSPLYMFMFSALLVQFVFFTGGIVFLTLIVNGSTTQFILHALGLDKLSAAKVR